MSKEKQILIWVVGLALFGALLSALSGVLMPFVAGMAVAYFLDPVADKLEEWGASRAFATLLILLAFFFLVLGGLILLFPLLQAQVVDLLARIPGLIEAIRIQAEPLLAEVRTQLPDDALQRLGKAAGSFAGQAVEWITGLLAGLWSGGLAFFNVLSLVLITPLVAFYLLRDWDRIIDHINSLLPRDFAGVIREQALEVDKTLAAFVRGQASVCLVLATFYSTGLSVAGLEYGLLVGIGAGLISFIPYIGASIGLAVGLAIAIAQFSDLGSILTVVAVFLVGQTAESYFLTPRLVGGRVGLQPIWIIFALLAGGALFGLTGVLLAVPVASVIGVLVRFARSRYLESALFNGSGGSQCRPEGSPES